MESNRASSRLFSGTFDEDRITGLAVDCREELGVEPSVVFAFVSPDWKANISELGEILQIHGHSPGGIGMLDRRACRSGRGAREFFRAGAAFSASAKYGSADGNHYGIRHGEAGESGPSPRVRRWQRGGNRRVDCTWRPSEFACGELAQEMECRLAKFSVLWRIVEWRPGKAKGFSCFGKQVL